MIQVSPFFVLLVTIAMVSCTEPDRGRHVPIPITNLPGEFKREVPMRNGEEDLFWLDELIPDLGLYKLDNGVTDIQVRFWIFHSMATKKQIVVLKRNSHGWCADLIEFTDGGDDSKYQQLKPWITKAKYDIFPNSGWSNFLTKLKELQVFHLLQSGNVQDHPGCFGADGMDYKFEFATSKIYRMQYHCVATETVRQLTELLEKEFDLTLVT